MIIKISGETPYDGGIVEIADIPNQSGKYTFNGYDKESNTILMYTISESDRAEISEHMNDPDKAFVGRGISEIFLHDTTEEVKTYTEFDEICTAVLENDKIRDFVKNVLIPEGYLIDDIKDYANEGHDLAIKVVDTQAVKKGANSG